MARSLLRKRNSAEWRACDGLTSYLKREWTKEISSAFFSRFIARWRFTAAHLVKTPRGPRGPAKGKRTDWVVLAAQIAKYDLSYILSRHLIMFVCSIHCSWHISCFWRAGVWKLVHIQSGKSDVPMKCYIRECSLLHVAWQGCAAGTRILYDRYEYYIRTLQKTLLKNSLVVSFTLSILTHVSPWMPIVLYTHITWI